MNRESEHLGSLAGLFLFLWRHRILFIATVGISTLATIVYVLLIPVEYTARATLIPQEAAGSSLASLAKSVMSGAVSALGPYSLDSETRIQEAVFKSEHLADSVNEKLDLAGRYGIKNRERRLRAWSVRFDVRTDKQGFLVIKYRDRDPEFASEVVNTAIEEVDSFNRKLRNTASRRARVFLEGRVAEVDARLEEMEDSLASYQSRHKALAFSTPADADIGANLISQRIRLETDILVLQKTVGPQAPALVSKRLEAEALDKELSRLPQMNAALSTLLRDRRVLEQTYGMLSASLEEARVQEAKNAPTVNILDPPVVPTEKSWPNRTLTVLTAFFVSAVAAGGLAYVLDLVRRFSGERGPAQG